jgi:hypothetical protein
MTTDSHSEGSKCDPLSGLFADISANVLKS